MEAQELKGATAKALHLPDNSGALLAGVMPDGPAAQAGLQPGDVIETVNGKKVDQPTRARGRRRRHQAGRRSASDRAARRPEQGRRAEGGAVAERADGKQRRRVAASIRSSLGLALAPLSPDMRGQLDVPDGTRGAVVRGVEPGSPAEQAGLQPGDVIVGVGTHPVTSPSEAAREIHSGDEQPEPRGGAAGDPQRRGGVRRHPDAEPGRVGTPGRVRHQAG